MYFSFNIFGVINCFVLPPFNSALDIYMLNGIGYMLRTFASGIYRLTGYDESKSLSCMNVY